MVGAVAGGAVAVVPATVPVGSSVASAVSRSSSLPAPVSIRATPAVAWGTNTETRPSPLSRQNTATSP
jgi:hypothetical protein